MNFPFESRYYFEEYVKRLEISYFEKLKKILLTDQIKQKFPLEMRTP